MTSRLLAVGIVLCLCGQLPSTRVGAQARPAGGPGGSTENQAREAFERGRANYDAGEFAKASLAFEEAYKLSGREGLLYNLYLAYRDANQQEKAAEALRMYLAKVPVIENRGQLEARLKALDEGIAQRKAREAAEAEAREQAAQQQAAASQASAQPDAQPAPAEPPGRWWLMPVGVMGGGAALMLGSIATGVVSNNKASKLEEECPDRMIDCNPNLKADADTGKTLAVVTDVLLFGGLATAAVGGLLLFLKRPKGEPATEDTPQANLACNRAGCAAGVSLRF